MHSEPMQGKTDVEWVNEIGSHVAAGDTLDEALAATVRFAVALVHCDFCFIYVRDGAELVLWVWKHLDQGDVEHAKLTMGRGYTASLAQHRVPMAISTDSDEQFEARISIDGRPPPAKGSCQCPCWPAKS